MEHEPPLDRSRLIGAIRRDYGLAVERLDFVPVGYAAACYVVRCADGSPAFLKLWPDTAAGRSAAARQAQVLPLLEALDGSAVGFRVPRPLRSCDGELTALADGLPFALFTFLAGRPAPEWAAASTELRDAMARALASLHGSAGALARLLPADDALATPWEAGLRAALDSVERIGPDRAPLLLALRDLVLPRRADVMRQLERLHDFRRQGRAVVCPPVLCHTDFGGDNVLVDERGALAVLDWDDAAIAPPEHDLAFAVGPGFARALAVYDEAGHARPLHLAHFGAALLGRYLEDMTARLIRLLNEQPSATEGEELLRGMIAWGFDRWPALDDTLAGVRAALSGRGDRSAPADG